MKTLDIDRATRTLAQYTGEVGDEPLVVTRKGRAVAALVGLGDTDLESLSLGTNPEFIELIQRSRVRHEREGGISSAEMRRRLGLA